MSTERMRKRERKGGREGGRESVEQRSWHQVWMVSTATFTDVIIVLTGVVYKQGCGE